MDTLFKSKKDIVLINMALTARLAIRDFFLDNTVKEIYENIGQVLSLVRMQLAFTETNNKPPVEEKVESTQQLIGQSIKDLRTMCKSFYPDADILKETGFIEAFENTVKILFPGYQTAITIKGEPADIGPELKLIVFSMMQDILTKIRTVCGKYRSLKVAYSKNQINFIVSYTGDEIPLDEVLGDDENFDLTLSQRAQYINAEFKMNKNKHETIQYKLTLPIKSLL